MAARLSVEVVCALPDRQVVMPVKLEPGATLGDAIRESGVLSRFPDLDLKRCGVGVFGTTRRLDDPVGEGDRVEIYRPLRSDPKEQRRRRITSSASG